MNDGACPICNGWASAHLLRPFRFVCKLGHVWKPSA